MGDSEPCPYHKAAGRLISAARTDNRTGAEGWSEPPIKAQPGGGAHPAHTTALYRPGPVGGGATSSLGAGPGGGALMGRAGGAEYLVP